MLSAYNALSDLDFALLTTEVLSVSEQLGFSAAFSDILKDDSVDLVFLNSSSLPLQYKTLEDGQLLYSRDDVFLADFVEIVIKRYCDFSIFLDRFCRLRPRFAKGVFVIWLILSGCGQKYRLSRLS
ncbi:MAG TPA: hypothetical protein GX521_07755 [Firmicutes bacterium]|nr:hypothetical protein [Bacillota bacterium]